MRIERAAKKLKNAPFQVHFFFRRFYCKLDKMPKLTKRLAAEGSNAITYIYIYIYKKSEGLTMDLHFMCVLQ